MPLSPGSRLGPYEIVAPLGKGGMGEVYRARDTRLDRQVAIKVMPPALAADPQFRERFDREARAISALDHPHICALYDVGEDDATPYLVMQFLEGETLADRLARSAGPLEVDEALRVAMQVCDGLGAAHRVGIVHRDLKPGNIFLTKAGAKLLDFGLAKVHARASSVSASSAPVSLTSPPTMTAPLTAAGALLGTFHYMSPEQLEGEESDPRSDIWALGCVLYEMLAGARPFEGRTQATTIGAILEREVPPLIQIQPLVSLRLDHVITRCLAKDPERRWQTAIDVLEELRHVSAAPAANINGTPSLAPPSRATRPAVAIAAVVAVAAASFVAGLFVRPAAPRAVVKFFVQPPPGGAFTVGGRVGAAAAISPEGGRIAFVARDSTNQTRLWLRSLDGLTAIPVPGTDDAEFPFWSPDSRSIGFFANDKLLKVDLSGGGLQTVCPASLARGGAWGPEGTIVFGRQSGSLMRVPAAGGQPTPAANPVSRLTAHRFPSFLPDGRHVLFYGAGGDASGVYVAEIDGTGARRVVTADTGALYAPSGHLLFVRQGTLLAQPFDASSLTLSGEPVPIAESVEQGVFSGVLSFAVSASNMLIYGTSTGRQPEIALLDRSGKSVGSMRAFDHMSISPDGKRLAVDFGDQSSGGRDVWLYEFGRSVWTRFTFAPGNDWVSTWTPDGSRIVFSSDREKQGIGQLYEKATAGGTDERLLLKTDENGHLGPPDERRSDTCALCAITVQRDESAVLARRPVPRLRVQ